jgi:hypothetical protein
LTNPTSNALDSFGRATTSTADYLARPLRRVVRANTTAVTLNQEIQFTGLAVVAEWQAAAVGERDGIWAGELHTRYQRRPVAAG